MSFDWKKVVASVAPMLGAALGGPLGGMAGQILGSLLGVDPKDPKAIEKAVLSATPDKLLEIQKAEADFKLQMEKLGFENEQALLRLETDDRASARRREVDSGDSWTPRILAACVVGGWIAVQAFLLRSVIDNSMRDLVARMLGTLDSALMLVLSYYYGSSAGSFLKSKLLSDKDKK